MFFEADHDMNLPFIQVDLDHYSILILTSGHDRLDGLLDRDLPATNSICELFDRLGTSSQAKTLADPFLFSSATNPTHQT
jgi:hypothetical protein